MPADFRNIIKHCESCGSKLKLNNTRDIERKRFCSRKCLYAIIQPNRFVPPHSEGTKQKMRESKQNLLTTGWKPIGWRKYTPQIRYSEHHQYLFKGHRRIHRLVMEQIIGRLLTSNELVHHKDENKVNNNPGNLEIVTRSEHMKLHTQRRRENALCV